MTFGQSQPLTFGQSQPLTFWEKSNFDLGDEFDKMDVAMMMETLKLVGINCNLEKVEKVKLWLAKSEV